MTRWSRALGRGVVVQAWLLAGAGLLTAAPAAAQATATLNGRVVDQDGAVLPGVTVSAASATTGLVRTTLTNGEGIYSLPGLDPGAYTLRAELAGFGPVTQEKVSVAVNATITLDFKLPLAGLEESVTVAAAVPLIEVTQSKVNTTIQTREVQNLPLLTRSVNGLVALLPGSKAVAAFHPYKRESGSVSFGGSAGRTAVQTIDGADNRDNVVGGAAVNLTVEGIEEFQVASHQFSAADGRSSGSALTILTKSGTNNLRGSAFFFGRDDTLQARDYFAARDDRPRPPFTRQQYGGSIGGPVVRNRVFFFGAAEGIREDTSAAVPDALYNEIARLEPFGAEPVHAILRPYWESRQMGKVSLQLDQVQSVMVRYAGQTTRRKLPFTTPNVDVSSPTIENHDFHDVVAQHRWILGAGALNQLTAHLSYFDDYLGPSLDGRRPRVSEYLDPAMRLTLANNLIFPSVRIGRAAGSIASNSAQTMWQIRDDVMLQVGPHALRMGGDFTWFPTLGGQVGSYAPSLTFFDDPSVILGNTNGRYPQGFQTPGIVRQWADSPASLTSDYFIDGAKQIKAYVQDDWRVGPRLTVNLGVRYDLDLNLYDQEMIPFNRTYQVLKAIGHPAARSLPKTPTRDIGPRLGFAYDLNGDGRRVLRGGYGLYFDQICQTANWQISAQSRQPYIFTATLTNTSIGVGELAGYRFGVDPDPAQPAPSEGFPAGARSNGLWFDPDVRNARNHQFHLGYSHELGPNTVLSADMTHVTGLDDARSVEINPLVDGVRRLAPALAQVYGDPNLLGSVLLFSTIGRTRYDELTVQLEQRLPRTTFRLSYILSGAYGHGGGIAGSQAPCCQAQDQDNLFGPGEWGPATSDERHRVVATGVFDLPGGIQVSPIMQAATARPYTLTAGLDLNGNGTLNDRYVDPATGVQAAVNSERGDPFFLVDLRATKSFGLGGERRLSVFAEFFNLFNTANFGSSYNGNARSVTFRQPNDFIPGGGYPFQVQLGARLQF